MTPWRWFLASIAVVEVLWLCLPPPQAVVEQWYSLLFYPFVSSVIVPIQNMSPIPVTALVIMLVAIVSGGWLVQVGRRLRAAGRSRWWLVPRALGMTAQASIVFLLWFLVIWGAGYQRLPVTARWSLDDANLAPEESAQMQRELLSIIRENVDDGTNRSRTDAVTAIGQSMARFLHGQGDGPVRVPDQVRATPPGLFLAFSTAGMCVPAAIEPFADGAYDDVRFVQVAAHELAHVAGYNRESEATLIGYLAGLQSHDALSRYAVALDVYMDLIGRVRNEDERKAAWDALPERAREDVRIGREIGARYRIKIRFFQRAGYHIYDTYLKSQGVNDGMANYSEGLRLFAGAWRKGLAATSPVLEAAEISEETSDETTNRTRGPVGPIAHRVARLSEPGE